MKNTHSKKLLACFLTALGLSMNSANVSAKYGQTRENIRYFCNRATFSSIFGGEKIKEKNDLDELAGKIEEFLIDISNGSYNIDISNGSYNNDYNNLYNKYFELCENLYKQLLKIRTYRTNNKFDSLLSKKLEAIVGDSEDVCYPGDKKTGEVKDENKNFSEMQNWIRKILGKISPASEVDKKNKVQGRHFSVYGTRIESALLSLETNKLVRTAGMQVEKNKEEFKIEGQRIQEENEAYLKMLNEKGIIKALGEENAKKFYDKIKKIYDRFKAGKLLLYDDNMIEMTLRNGKAKIFKQNGKWYSDMNRKKSYDFMFNYPKEFNDIIEATIVGLVECSPYDIEKTSNFGIRFKTPLAGCKVSIEIEGDVVNLKLGTKNVDCLKIKLI